MVTTTQQTRTLIILNPNAGGGRAGKLWSKIEPQLWRSLGELVVAITPRPEDVAVHLDKAAAAGLTRVISIGGDGTNHVLINAILRVQQENPSAPRMTFGCIPIGTGSDWARTFAIPLDPLKAVQWISRATTRPIDVGQVTAQDKAYHFLNVASVGIGGDVSVRVNRTVRRRPWTFYRKTVESLLWYRPVPMQVKVDGTMWYDGSVYAVAVANGQNFGHGMRIAPDARADDGQFDVVLIEGMPRLQAIRALNTVYDGTHVLRNDVHVARGSVVEVSTPKGALPMELDGESRSGGPIRFEALHSALNMLVSPSL